MPLFLLHIPKSEKKSVKMAEKCFYSDFYLTRNSNPGKKNHFICKYFKSPQLINLRKRTVCILITRLLSLSKIHL